MKFAIYGAGAVGAFLGARLLENGQEVHFIARGANLDAQRERGLVIRSAVFGEKRYE
ncbi:MAG: 2-dehydropantoate 2-reductase, partial [Chloroflexi bacterium]|nr:2-dehydropantoate 2-reductase [Chloroflexota bacterium]